MRRSRGTKPEAANCSDLRPSTSHSLAITPLKLDAAAIIDCLSFQGTCPPVLILKGCHWRKGHRMLSQAWCNGSASETGPRNDSRANDKSANAKTIQGDSSEKRDHTRPR